MTDANDAGNSPRQANSPEGPRPRGQLALEMLPAVFVAGYLSFTIWLFFEGPIAWPITNGDSVFLFLAIVVTALFSGFTVGASAAARGSPLKHWRLVFIGGAIASCAILFPSAYVYTGKMPWQVLEALRDQNLAYRTMLDRLVETDGTRAPLALIRAATYPLVFAVVPLGILHWNRLGWILRVLLLASLASNLVFSILRGTDRETFDAAIAVATAVLIATGRYCLRDRLAISDLFARPRTFGVLAIACVVAVMAVNTFSDRKALRYDGDLSKVCVGEQICADADHPLLRGLQTGGQFTVAMMTAYLAQGYYGLSLAMNLDFQSTFGFGHSPLAARVYEAATGDASLYERSYTYRLRDWGWSDENQWSTFFTWIANDIGFPATIPVIALIGWFGGLAWKDAVFAGNDRAAIVFCFFVQMCVYLPANNQVMQTLDAYFAIVVWTAVWIWRRRTAATASPIGERPGAAM